MKKRDCTNTMLFWSPETGDAVLVDFPMDINDPRYYDYCSGLACYEHFRNASFEKRKSMLFVEFPHIVVRDGIDPMKLHKLLMGLEEYRSGMAYDMPKA